MREEVVSVGLLGDRKVVAQLESDVAALREFFDSYCRFDDARILFEKSGQYRGDKSNAANSAYAALMSAKEVAAVVAERVRGEAS
jgi:hypothetical protein